MFILKIIGIVLLVILGLVLVLLLLVLFWPVGFKADFKNDDEGMAAGGRVSWLGPLVCFFGDYDGESFSYRLRVFFINIIKSDSSKGEDSEGDAPAREGGFDSRAEELSGGEAGAFEGELRDEEPTAPDTDGDAVSAREETDSPAAESAKDDFFAEDVTEGEAAASKKDKKNKRDKKGKRPRKKGSSSGIFDKIKSVFSSEFAEVFSHFKKCLGKMLKHFKIKDAQGDLSYSAGAPDITGMLTGVISLFPFAYGRKLSIAPDFIEDSPYVRGWIRVRARFMLFFLLVFALRLFFDKKTKAFIGQIRGN
ncbi:MAG: hypothetical protein K5840_06065 [Eubacterium sp.]|nr:hypothetical protein [Eubacterium sp.]